MSDPSPAPHPTTGPDGQEPIPGFLCTCRLAPDGTYTLDAPRDQTERLYEFPPEEVARLLTAGQLPFLPDAEPELGASFRASAENLTPWIGDCRVVGPRTGRERWVRTHAVPRREPDGAVVWTVIVTEITDLKAAQLRLRETAAELARSEALDRQLLDAQKWESLGVMAGGVAHDFNNILTVVLGSAGLARRGLAPDCPALAHLDQIEHASRRAAELCRQMLAYAGHGPGTPGRAELAALVRESTPLLEVPASRAAIRFELDDRLPAIHADPAQVRQVLVNLVLNAAEALEGGPGEIVVGADAVEVPPGPPDASFRLAPPPGLYARLSVSDTGPGLTPEVQARMFDPFYSTKFAGRGLGLAAVLGIVRAHKGGLRVDSASGRGATFAVYWPTSADAAPTPAAATEPDTRPRAAALVIDDEMYVREVTASALEEIGFAPLLAADGPSGVEAFRAHRDAIRLVVIDVVMPGMTGDQVLEAIRALAPEVPAVLMSGFTDRRVVREALAARTEFLQKPFHPEELMAAVRRLVG